MSQSRLTDVDTAVLAGAQIMEAVPRLQAMILHRLAIRPNGLSSRQLAYELGVDFGSISPRLRPMADKGWVEMTNQKAKNPTGKGWGRVWIITPLGRGTL
jgi:predicted transcriptional regulator